MTLPTKSETVGFTLDGGGCVLPPFVDIVGRAFAAAVVVASGLR